MALEFLNTLDITNIGIQGLRVYGRPRGVPGKKLVDFGNIENLAPNREATENPLQSARNGVRTTVKVLSSSLTDSYTFDSLDITDKTVAALHEGADSIPVVGKEDSQSLIVRTPGAKTEMELFVLEPGAPNTDSRLLYVPRVQLEGNGSTPSAGNEAARLGFKVTLLTDEAYKVPAGLIASNPNAPHGVVGLLEASATPINDLHTLAEALMAPLDAEGGP